MSSDANGTGSSGSGGNDRYRGRDGNMSGNGSGSRNNNSDGSGGNRSNFSGTSAYEDDEIDIIYDEDLADANNDISLGRSGESDEGLSIGSVDFVYKDSEATIPKGYIDDAIVQEVMNSADERLNKKKPCSVKMAMYVVGTAAILATIGLSLIVGIDSLEKKRIEGKIDDRSSAFEFDDRDEYAKPDEDEPMAEKGKTKFGGTEDKTTEAEVTTGTETITGSSSVLGTKIPLASEIILPSFIENFLVDPRLTVNSERETPLFWQVPFAGGTFQSFMTACSKKVLASNHKEPDDDEIKIHMVGESPYVNVDLSTTEGIENAAKKGLTATGLADVIVSNHIHFTTNKLFDAKHKGRLFTALRHPVDRCISEYHYVMTTTNDPTVESMSLDEFASSRYMDKDWMTRFLVNKQHVPLGQEDLQLAKEILRRRCLVGLHEDIELSIKLFEQYFGWTVKGKSITNAHNSCLQAVISRENTRAMDVYHNVGNVKKDSAVYNKIVELNKFDMELYWYAFDLFEEQQLWVKSNREGL